MVVEVSGEPGKVAIKGIATVSSAEEIATALREALGSGAAFTVDVAGLERADMSLVQLIVSATRSARDAELAFAIEGDPTPLLHAAGGSPDFLELVGPNV